MQPLRARPTQGKPLKPSAAAWRPGPSLPEPPRLARVVVAGLHWLAERRIGGPAGSGLRALLHACTPSPAASPKALSVKLRSIRRLWGSSLTIGIRLKW